MGHKDFPAANCVRAILGNTDEGGDEVVELRCNLDDMTGEAIGFAMEQLFYAGALDVFTTPIYMKKNRPGVMLTVICSPDMAEPLGESMLKYTTTRGVRRTTCSRITMDYDNLYANTPYGRIKIKHSFGHGLDKVKPEFNDVYAAAQRNNVPMQTIYDAALIAINEQRDK